MTNKTIEERMAAMEEETRGRPRRNVGLPIIGGGLAVVGALGAYLLAANMQGEAAKPLNTSDVEEFQRGPTNGERLVLETPEPEQRVEEAIIRIEEALQAPTPPAAVPAKDDTLASELAAMRVALTEATAGRDQAIAEAVAGLKSAFEDRATELEAAARQAETDLAELQSSADARAHSLQTMLDAERSQRKALEAAMERDERMALEAARAEQAARDAAALEKLQIESPAVIYANSQSVVATGGTAAPGGEAERKLSADEAFLQSAPALVVQQAERMQDPDRTLAQGSVVQAALQVAINSDLPGNVVAVVSEPVPSFAGDNILIPRGSKLFGSYSAAVQGGQKRILIAWSRILTPDGISMQIASVGGDRLGRSGVTGFVDSKFRERFGGAALISLIGAGPSIAAAQVDDDITRDTLESVGEDFEDATDTVIAEQLSRKPTIYIDQGASVTVLVDRDVVIW